jgi:hypothetical protein
MTTTVFVRDVVNHRIHKRFRDDGTRGLYAHEAEALDTSGAYVVLTDAEMSEISPEDLCTRCFSMQEGELA